jgi:hypothetical protein
LVLRQRRVQGRQCFFVNSDQQFGRRRGSEDFIEEDFQGRMRYFLQPQRRLAHLAHASTEGLNVFGTQIGVVGKTRLQLVNRLGRDAGGQDFVQTEKRIMVALEAFDTRLDA